MRNTGPQVADMFRPVVGASVIEPSLPGAQNLVQGVAGIYRNDWRLVSRCFSVPTTPTVALLLSCKELKAQDYASSRVRFTPTLFHVKQEPRVQEPPPLPK